MHLKRPRFARLAAAALIAALAAASWGVASAADYPKVDNQRLLNAQSDSGWLMYRRSYDSKAFAPFKQIDADNVSNLKPVFSHKTGLTQGHEAAPIVNGRYMFITTPLNHLIALDATTGKQLWSYKRKLSKKATKTVCCDVVNRGVALYDDMVYMATLDNHVLAFTAATGKLVWDKKLQDEGVGYALTVAPLVVKGKVVVGESGGEYGARDFIAALDAEDGSQVWKRYTVPSPDEPNGDTWPEGAYKHAGSPAWLTGSYDPDTDTLFWGVGNPGPWLAKLRPGKNLYSDSVLALDPATGDIKWYYQFTPHDTWDYDGVNHSVLADINYKGRKVKALLHADRNGYFFALDRTNGKFLWAKPFVKATSITGYTDDGVAIDDKDKRPDVGKKIFTCPSFLGGKNWWPMAVNPEQGLAFVPTLHACMSMEGTAVSYMAGLPYLGEKFEVRPEPGSKGWGEVQAIDINTGKQVWSHRTERPWNDGMLATASGLVFSGSADGHFMAFDGKSGKVLWSSKKLASGIIGVPTSYEVDGKQYVAVYAGWGGATPIWGGKMADDPKVKNIDRGGKLYVFALN
ncbi:MAG TPA: methanol/ethanol family PQQ-dependent dehydrogenase [Gammaproteobacteria bacterium]|nr:methanol/ethanol family PQQ-dependent dehydrogenase [Gammaproteobacteria bacterium]